MAGATGDDAAAGDGAMAAAEEPTQGTAGAAGAALGCPYAMAAWSSCGREEAGK